MLKKICLFLLIISTLTAAQNQKLTLEKLILDNPLSIETITQPEWRPDGSAISFIEIDSLTGLNDIRLYNISKNAEEVFLNGKDILYNGTPVNMSKYSWTDDGKYLLIVGPEKSIWRHSKQAPYYLYNVETKELTALSNNNPRLRNVKLSPDGKLVGFVRDHNIYTADILTGNEIAVTKSGTDNILNGEFDWVYEEEFSIADGWRWSPDGKKIAFWQFDQTRVKEFYLVDEMNPYNKIQPLKYPKVGEQNSIVKIGVADIESGNVTWVDLGGNDDIYIPRIYWINSDHLTVLRLNRAQNFLEYLMADASTGNAKVILTDESEHYVDVENDDVIFLKNKDRLILTSERSGFNHAYLYDYSGKLINQITSGDWEVSKLINIDEEKKHLYFYGKKESPIEQHIYRIDLDGKNLTKISGELGHYEANFSPDFNYYFQTASSADTPIKYSINKSDGSLYKMLEKNQLASIEKYDIIFPDFFQIRTSDGVYLNSFIMKPNNFDSTKTYPVIVFGYGGPGAQDVENKWEISGKFLWHNYMLSKGYIIFMVDNRGTGGRGKKFEDLAWGDLGRWSVNDQIEGRNYLASLPFIDSTRIGFWGWSGGGYLALMLMTKGAGNFNAAVAVAPVSDFRLYDAIWTERYMGDPEKNKEGYEKASPLYYADKLKGDLLIIHGTGDDNVHYQNTMMMVKALQQNLKQFDLMLYPNKNHSIPGNETQLHLYKKMTDFFEENLR